MLLVLGAASTGERQPRQAEVQPAVCVVAGDCQEEQHESCAVLPTARTTLECVNGSKMAREWLRDGRLASRRLSPEDTALQDHSTTQQRPHRAMLPRQPRATDARGT